MGTARKVLHGADRLAKKALGNRGFQALLTGGASEGLRAVDNYAKKLTGVDALEEAQAEAEAAAAAEAAKEKKLERAATAEAYADLKNERRRRAAIRGRGSTILTGPLGAEGLELSRKTLLGG